MGINSSLRATEPIFPLLYSLEEHWWFVLAVGGGLLEGLKLFPQLWSKQTLSQHLNKRALPAASLSQLPTATYTNSHWQWLGAAPLPGTQPGPALCPASCQVSCLWSPPSCSSCFLKHRALLLPLLLPRNHDKLLLEISVRLNSSEPPPCTCCPTGIHHSICTSSAAPVFQLGNHGQN